MSDETRSGPHLRAVFNRDAGVQHWEVRGEMSVADWLAMVLGVARIPAYEECPRIVVDARRRRLQARPGSFESLILIAQDVVAEETDASLDVAYVAGEEQAEAIRAAEAISKSGKHCMQVVSSVAAGLEVLGVRRDAIDEPRLPGVSISPSRAPIVQTRPLHAVEAPRELGSVFVPAASRDGDRLRETVRARLLELELTDKQREVVEALVVFGDIQQVADELALSVHTVRNHLQRAYRRARVNSMLELISRMLFGGR